MRAFILLMPAAILLASAAHADGDPVAGKAVFRKCMACHSVEANNKVGPNLENIVGRPVASVEDYRYSKAMTAFAEGGRLWNEALLAEYLMSPRTMVKGTSMAFAGLKKLEDIVDLTAYLKNPAAAP